MNIIKKISIIIFLLGVLIVFNAFGDDTSSKKIDRKHHGPPPEAYCACEGKNVGDTAEFITPNGDTITGTCEQERDGDRLVLRPDNPPERGPGERPMRNDRD